MASISLPSIPNWGNLYPSLSGALGPSHGVGPRAPFFLSRRVAYLEVRPCAWRPSTKKLPHRSWAMPSTRSGGPVWRGTSPRGHGRSPVTASVLYGHR
jgi:hypothetical protein